MATQGYWAEAPVSRTQSTLFNPSLDDMIEEDSQIRLFDEVLAKMDWSEWEAEHPAPGPTAHPSALGRRRVVVRPLSRNPL